MKQKAGFFVCLYLSRVKTRIFDAMPEPRIVSSRSTSDLTLPELFFPQ